MGKSTLQDITSLHFKPPTDEQLAIEAMTIDELRLRAPTNHFEKLQRANFFRLFGVASGATSFMVDFSVIAAKTQDWILIRPGQVIRYDFSQPWTGWLVVFRPDQLVNRISKPLPGELGL